MSTYYIASRPITHQDIKKINKYILDDLAKNKGQEYATINLSCELIEKTYAISYKYNYLIIFDYNKKQNLFPSVADLVEIALKNYLILLENLQV